METIRTFIAIDLPSAVKDIIAETQSLFKEIDLRASWVKPESLHLTLKFLGDVPYNRVVEIRNRLGQGLVDHTRFQVSLGGLGVFPGWNRPRVFWIEIQEENRGLYLLWSQVETQLEIVGFAKNNKKFSPHLTLARIKSPERKGRLQKKVTAWRPLPRQPFEVTEVKLYKSRLTPQGSIYTVLETFPFRKS